MTQPHTPAFKFASLVFLAIALTLGFWGCKREQPILSPAEAANVFFLKLSKARFKDAYESASFSFRAKTNYKNFEATSKELGVVVENATCAWQNQEFNGRDAKLTGEVVLPEGNRVPIIVTLIQENHEWRVFSLHTPGGPGEGEKDRFNLVGKGDSFNSLANTELPSPKLLDKLTLESLLLFNDAIQQKDFKTFYSKVSQAWQSQLTVGQLQRAFQPFVDAGVNVQEIERLTPLYDKTAEINTDGILVVQGHYDTKPFTTCFRLRFTYEFPNWKLLGLEVQIRD